MANVILLSDNLVFGAYGSTRYMGAYALASQLESENIKTLVIDYFTRKVNFFDYLKQFLSAETKIIGISSTFLFPNNPTTKKNSHRSDGVDTYYTGELWFEKGSELLAWTAELRATLNAISPDCKIVLGGVKAQFAHWRPEFYKNFDHIFFGAADLSIVDYYRKISADDIFLAENRFITQKESLKNQGICPVCNYQKNWSIRFKESLPIEISRGCLYNCKFCHYEKKDSQRKDLSKLKDEFIYNFENFGTTVYHFCDDCFNDTRKKVEDTCNMFLSLPFKIEWVGYARTDVAVKFNSTLDLMLESGARGLYWGIESFDYKAALAAGKGTHPDLVKDFFLSNKEKMKNKCMNEGSFIIGLPGEDKESIYKTLDWLKQNDVFDFATFGPLGLMPYTENFDKLIFDYADYSRNPEKYGFTKIEFSPKKYWEHQTMNSLQAADLARDLVIQWSEHKQSNQVFGTIWLYPHLRTLGYTHDEIIGFLKPDPSNGKHQTEIKNRFQSFLNQYFLKLEKT